MRLTTFFTLFIVCFSPLFSQNILTTHDPNITLTDNQCYDLVKSVWDGLKKLSEEHQAEASEKSEFESTAEYNERILKSKESFINKIRKFYTDNNLSSKTYSVWLKAELSKYDADNQTYGIKSPTQILVQPKKKEIAVICTQNKYVAITEKNTKGYRRAYLHLATNPEFTWYVNKQTALNAKNKEQSIFFKLAFTFDISYNEKENQITLQLVPSKLSLLDQSENFTYWSDDIR